MTTFRFGTLDIDPVAYAIAGNAILGIRDSGKSYTATGLAERLFDAGIPFVTFDPTGIWRFLRVPGAGGGYPVVVAGGKAGDLPLTPASAPALVEAAMQGGVSVVLDLHDINLSKADWRRIVRDSVRLLMHRNAEHGLRHIFIEEAAEFVPQKVLDGEVYAELEKLARMGGNSRLGYTLINQRSQEVNKAVLELCENMFLHRQKGKNALESLAKWLDVADVSEQRAIMKSLPNLPTGECWAWLGDVGHPVHVKVPPKGSFHPDRRVMRGDTDAPARAAVDVGQFVETMRATLVTVEQEAADNDPKVLKKRITELERQVAEGGGASPEELAAAEERGRDRGYGEGFHDARDGIALAVQQAIARVQEPTERPPLAPVDESRNLHRKPVDEMRNSHIPATATAAPRATAGRGEADPQVGTGGLRRMLIALAQRPQGMSARALGVRAGLSSSSGTFGTYLGKGRAAGWIEGERECLRITSAGKKALGRYEPLPTGRALLAYWISELGNSGASRLLQALADAYPRALSRDVAAQRADLSAGSGTFGTYLGKLRTLELVSGGKELRASEELFD